MNIKTGFIPVAGGEIYYETAGSGPAVFFIHAGICNCTMWDEQFLPLAEQYQVIRYDTRGYGRTTSDNTPFSNRADLQTVLNFLGIPSACIVGCSRGGQIALDFAVEFPAYAHKLVLVAAGVSGFPYEPQMSLPTEVEYFEKLEALWDVPERDLDQINEGEIHAFVEGLGQSASRLPAGLRQRVLSMNRHNLEISTTHPIQPIPLDPPAYNQLKQLNIPVLIVYGNLDENITQLMAQDIAQKLPQTQLVLMEGTAHLPSMERPAEFNQLLLQFLQK